MKHLSKPQMKALEALGQSAVKEETTDGLNARLTTMLSLHRMALVSRAWRNGWLWSITEAGRQYIADGRTESLLLSSAQWGALIDLSKVHGVHPPTRTVKVLNGLGLVRSTFGQVLTLTELGKKLVEAKR